MKIISHQTSAFPSGLTSVLFPVICLLVNILTQVRAQCCLQYDGALCSSCPTDMHLYQGYCLLNIPNCIQYSNGFQCSQCLNGYQLDSMTQQCVLSEFSDQNVPQNGFIDLPASEYSSSKIKNMENATKQYLKAKGLKQEIQQTAKIFVRKATNIAFELPLPEEDRFLRFIYYTNTGYIDIITFYQAAKPLVPQKFVAIKQMVIDKRPEQEYIDWDNYVPLGHKRKVLQILNTRYPGQSTLSLLQVFRNIQQYLLTDPSLHSTNSTNSGERLQSVYTFRLLLVDPNIGITPLEIPITAPNDTEVLDESLIDSNLRLVLNIFNTTASFANYLVGTKLTELTITQDTYNSTYTHIGIFLNDTEAISFITFVIYYSTKQVQIQNSFFFLAQVQPQFSNITNTSNTNDSININININNNTNNQNNNTNNSSSANEIILNITNPFLNNTNNSISDISTNATNQTVENITNNSTMNNKSVDISNNSIPNPAPNSTTLPPPILTINETSIKSNKSFLYNFTSSITMLTPPSSTLTPALVVPGPKFTANSLLLSIPKVGNLLNKGKPTFKQVGPDFDMVEILDMSTFLQSKVYPQIRNVIVNYRFKIFINGNLQKASIGQNQTMYIVQILYQQSQINRNHEYYAFALYKQTKNFELIRQFTVPYSDITIIDFSTLASPDQQAKFDANLKYFVRNLLPKDPLYNLTFKLSTVTIFEFNTRFQISSFSMKFFQKYYAKFICPKNSNYQYIEFQFQVADRKLGSLRTLGRIFYEEQIFIPYFEKSVINQLILSYLISYLQSSPGSLQLLSVYASKSRKDVYRTTLNLNNLTNLTYQFDLREPKSIRLMYNPTNFSNQVFATNLTTSGSNLRAKTSSAVTKNISTITSEFNVFRLLNFFPYLYSESLWKPVPIDPASSNQLSITNATSIISQFFNPNFMAINNVIIISRQTLFSVLDSYTLQYTEKVPLNSPASEPSKFTLTQPRRFTFQIPNRSLAPINIRLTPFLSSSPFFLTGIEGNQTSQADMKQKKFINVTNTLASEKPVQVLQTILNRSVNIVPQDQNISLNTSSSTWLDKNFTNRVQISNFLANTPYVLPLSYSQGKKLSNLADISLSSPEKPSNQTLQLLANTILNPNTYTPSLAVVQSQRRVKDDPDSIIVSLSHVYFGEMKILASLKNSSVFEIQYPDSGYLIGTTDTGIVVQVEEIYNTTRFLEDQLTSALKNLNYSEGSKPKVVNEQDIIYWRLKRIQNILQYQFVYEFEGFVVIAGVLQEIDGANKSNNKMFLTRMEALSNSNRLLKMHQVMNSEQFKRVQAKIVRSFSFYLKDYELTNVETGESRGGKIYNLTYLNKLNPEDIYVLQAQVDRDNNIIISMLNAESQQKLPEGCLLPSRGYRRCSICKQGFKLSKKNQDCFVDIQNCSLQASELCLACASSYRLVNYTSCL